jgi:serine/threonine protein kinase
MGSFLDTLAYTAPYAIKDPAHASFESDLWSLGITMTVVLTGEHPYPQRNGLLPLVNAITRGSQPTLDSTCFPSELCDFVTACLNQPEGDSTSADRLLHHPFILAAKERGIVSDDGQVKLSIPCPRRQRSQLSSEMLTDVTVNSIIDRQLDDWAACVGIPSEYAAFPESMQFVPPHSLTRDQFQHLAEQIGVSADLIQFRFESKYEALNAVRGKARSIVAMKKALHSSQSWELTIEMNEPSYHESRSGKTPKNENQCQEPSPLAAPTTIKVIRIQNGGMKHEKHPKPHTT